MADARGDIVQARIGTTLKGKWTLEKLLGTGGMAAVYSAVHKIGRRDAIKILHPEVAASPDLKARFEREAEATNRFKHPGSVEIRDYDVTDDGCPFLVMEHLEGESLGERARRLGGIPEDELLRYVDELCDVLAAAHREGIVHRDIKLDNLFVTTEGRLKVLDFGIARVRSGPVLTMTGMRLGTTAYMPPEQIAGRDIDGRADLFAVGATMFRILAKRRIHEAPTDGELVVMMSTEPAPPLRSVAPHVSENIARIVDLALAFRAEDRYPNAMTMQEDVRAVREGGPPPFATARREQHATRGGAFTAIEPTGVAAAARLGAIGEEPTEAPVAIPPRPAARVGVPRPGGPGTLAVGSVAAPIGTGAISSGAGAFRSSPTEVTQAPRPPVGAASPIDVTLPSAGAPVAASPATPLSMAVPQGVPAGTPPSTPPPPSVFASAGPASLGPQSLGPQSMGPHAMGAGPSGPYAMGPHSMGPHSMGPQSMGPQSMGPHSMGPHSMGPQSMGPHSMGAQSLGPQSMGMYPTAGAPLGGAQIGGSAGHSVPPPRKSSGATFAILGGVALFLLVGAGAVYAWSIKGSASASAAASHDSPSSTSDDDDDASPKQDATATPAPSGSPKGAAPTASPVAPTPTPTPSPEPTAPARPETKPPTPGGPQVTPTPSATQHTAPVSTPAPTSGTQAPPTKPSSVAAPIVNPGTPGAPTAGPAPAQPPGHESHPTDRGNGKKAKK